uniref:Putative glycine-rich cell wall structural protein 1 n=1 Tax=Amblyomma triste TaxID=251400 RepID=A0A023G8J0_AMBTT
MNSLVIALVLCGLVATVHCGHFGGGGHSVIVVKGLQTGGGGGAGFGHGSAASATTAGAAGPQVVQGPTYVVKTLHQVKKVSHGGAIVSGGSGGHSGGYGGSFGVGGGYSHGLSGGFSGGYGGFGKGYGGLGGHGGWW